MPVGRRFGPNNAALHCACRVTTTKRRPIEVGRRCLAPQQRKVFVYGIRQKAAAVCCWPHITPALCPCLVYYNRLHVRAVCRGGAKPAQSPCVAYYTVSRLVDVLPGRRRRCSPRRRSCSRQQCSSRVSTIGGKSVALASAAVFAVGADDRPARRCNNQCR